MPTHFEEQVLNDLGELKTNMKSLIGNGQPGRIDKIETAVGWHGKVLNRIIGGLIVLNVGLGAAIAVVHYLRI